MANSSSNFVINLAHEYYNIKCKYGHDNKQIEMFVFKYRHCDCFLQYTNFKHNLIEYKCLYCNKSYQRKFAERLKKQFLNTYNFSNHDINKFI